MVFVIVGVILLGLKLAGVSPVGSWSWWAISAPFGVAAVWWVVADATGLTQRFAISRFESRRAARRRRAMELLGLVIPGSRRKRPADESLPATAAMPSPSVVPIPPPPPKPKTPEPDFGDTVPSMIDVPEELGTRRPDQRRLG